VTVPRLAGSLKATKFSLTALRQIPHYCIYYLSTCIQPVFLVAYFFAAKPEGTRVISALTSGTEVTLFPLWSNVVLKLTLDDTVKSIHFPKVCSS
jgi:hypothetical protein